MRKLQDDNEAAVEGEGTFDVEVLLSDDEQVDVGGSPGFDALEYLSTLVVLAMIPFLFWFEERNCIFLFTLKENCEFSNSIFDRVEDI